LLRQEYPNFEVIVVDDGSSDETAAIVREYSFKLISTANRGLSSARNTGLKAAAGEIVAYTDDDACPDPHWLTYLASTFMSTKHVGVGGPNIRPPGDGIVAGCVANAPGGPVHVLLSDREAEHIPGCNMAFRKAALQEVGGFDPRFRTAGDDVDLCWRLQQNGGTLGFNHAAMVWHHRRNSVRAYWKQQFGYGKAESLLEAKWPENYNAVGHRNWAGRIYGKGLTSVLGLRSRIYHGMWGSAPFQSLYQPAAGIFQSLPLMPEWYLIMAAVAVLSTLGFLWAPLFLLLPLLGFTVVASLSQAALTAYRVHFRGPMSRFGRWKRRGIIAFLHLLQPLARLCGRLSHGLTPWRQRGTPRFVVPRARTFSLWSEQWQSADSWLRSLESSLRTHSAVVSRGGDYDRWDFQLRGGLFGSVRVRMAIEEHGAGKQLIRFRSWPKSSRLGQTFAVILALLSAAAAIDQASLASVILGFLAVLLTARSVDDCAAATASYQGAIHDLYGALSIGSIEKEPSVHETPKRDDQPAPLPAVVRALGDNGNRGPEIISGNGNTTSYPINRTPALDPERHPGGRPER
jgi:GT2 family glycosyltransferase